MSGFLSMGKYHVENSGTIKPAFLIRTLVKAYKTLAKEEPAMRTHAAREIALLRSIRGMKITNRSKTDPHQASP